MSSHRSGTKKLYARLYGILAPACSGKTTLFNKLRQYSIKLQKGKAAIPLILIDIDEMTFESSDGIRSNSSSSAEHRFPLLKDKVDDTLNRYPKYRAIVISSNPELLKYLNIKEKRIRVFVQGLSLFVQGIFPLLSVPARKSTDDDDNDDSDSDDNDDRDNKDNKPPQKPLPVPKRANKTKPVRSASASPGARRGGGHGTSGRSSSFGPSEEIVASPLTARLALEMSAITGAVVTVENDNGTDTTHFDFGKEVVDVCRSRDRIMIEYKESFRMYDTYEDFFDMVVDDFNITYRLK
jgi:hypothetical protein